MSEETAQKLKIAVVGSGISGLVCAWLLAPEHDVTVFEARDRIGGHTHTVTVERPHGTYAVDTGFIVYNERNYPGFTRLLAALGVASQPTQMSFSVRCDRTDTEYNGSSLNQLFTQRRNLVRPRFLRMVRDILRFNREARALVDEVDDTTTVDAWLSSSDHGEAFVEHYLLPLGSSAGGSDLAWTTGGCCASIASRTPCPTSARRRWRSPGEPCGSSPGAACAATTATTRRSTAR